MHHIRIYYSDLLYSKLINVSKKWGLGHESVFIFKGRKWTNYKPPSNATVVFEEVDDFKTSYAFIKE